jgi:hypothetical protein
MTFREDYTDLSFEDPIGSLELSIAAILAEVLGVDRYGRSDNFYDFGGTSLEGIRACAKIERETRRQAIPIWLFESDDLAEFVKRLEAEGSHVGD